MGTICYYLPDVGFDRAEKERRTKLMQPHLPPGYRIVFSTPPDGPEFVDADDDVLKAKAAVRAHFPTIGPEHCDALLLGEALDSVLAIVRPLARVPVVAPGEETLRLAAKIGKPTTIIVMNRLDKGLAQTFVEQTQIKPEIASIKSMDVPLRELIGDLQMAKELLARVAREAVKQDGAQAILLGAMTLNTLGLSERLRSELAIPVYDPLRIGLKIVGEVAYQQVGEIAGS